MLFGFAIILGAVLLLAAAASFLADAPEPPPECAPGTECGGPPGEAGPSTVPGPTFAVAPTAPSALPPGTVGIRAGQVWAPPDRAFEFEFSDWWAIEDTGGNRVDLAFRGPADALLIVASVPAAEASVEAYADRWADVVAGEAPDLRVDTSDKNTILGPGIGFIDGVGRTYAGTLTSPQSATSPIGVSLLTASDGRTTAAVVLIVWNPDKRVGSTWLQHAVRGTAELVLKTFRWAPQ
jgi:hypothetical protein